MLTDFNSFSHASLDFQEYSRVLPVDPAQHLFVLVDQQTAYCQRPISKREGMLIGVEGTEETEMVSRHNVEVLETFRNLGVKTAFVYTSSGAGIGPESVSTAMGGPYLLKGQAIDIIFPKLSDSVDTPKGKFMERVGRLGIKHIWWGGFGTSACLETSVFDVFNEYGISCTVLSNCTANNLNARLDPPILNAAEASARKDETFRKMMDSGIGVATSEDAIAFMQELQNVLYPAFEIR